MSRRRIILIGIIVSCAAVIVLSVMGVWKESPKSGSVGEQAAPRTEQAKEEGAPSSHPSGSQITHLKYPEYNTDGTRKYELRADKASEMLGLKNSPLLMENAEIEIYDAPGKKKGDPHTMTVRAKKGRWDRATRDAQLKDDVIIQVDPETRITAEEISWVPRENKVFSQSPVKLAGKEVTITGTGFDANLITREARIQKDVKVVITGTTGFSLQKKGKKQEGAEAEAKENKAGKKLEDPITITCSKDLLFAQIEHRATFHEDVKAVRGESRLNSAELEITFNKEADAVKMVIASGDVHFSDKDLAGTADKIAWNADDESATLSSTGMSEISQGPNKIRAKTIRLFQAEERMLVDGAGQLCVLSKSGLRPLEGGEAEKKPKTIDVFWEKDMLYQANEAVFQGHVKVIEQDGMQLDTDRLTVSFGEERSKVRKVLATGNVKLRDQGRTAYGDRLEWDALEGEGVLTSNQTVRVEDDDNLISAKALRFSHTDDRLVAEGAGYLVGSKTAKGANENEKGKESIRVIWEDGMKFDRKEHRAVFRKNVDAARGKTKLRSQELEILFDDANKEIQKIIARKKVFVEEDNRRGEGEEATYDAVTEEAVLVGGDGKLAKMLQEEDKSIEAPVIYMSRKTNAVRTDGGGHLVFNMKEQEGKQEAVSVTWKGRMNFDTEKHQAVFTDDVHAERGEQKIDAEELTVLFDEANREVQNIVAVRDVRLVEGNRKAQGDEFVWNAAAGFVEMKGKPQAIMESEQGFFIKCPVIRQFQEANRMEAEGAGNLEFDNPQKKMDGGESEGQKIRVEWQDRLVFPRGERKATFFGEVVVTSGTRRLEAEKLELFLDEKEEPQEMHAYEDIIVSDTPSGKDGKEKETFEATGDKLVWTAQDDRAVLSGARGANLFHGGWRHGASSEWQFIGFFAGEAGEKRVVAPQGPGPVIITIPERVNPPQ